MLRQYLARQPKVVRQFAKFFVTGIIGSTVDFGTFYLLTRVLGWRTLYSVFGYQIIAANMVSVLLAILSNFIMNKFWTFRDRRTEVVVGQGVSYFALNGFTWVLNQLLTSYFAFRVVLFMTLFGDQRDFAAKAAAIGIILFVNFFGSKFLVFRTPSTPPQSRFSVR